MGNRWIWLGSQLVSGKTSELISVSESWTQMGCSPGDVLLGLCEADCDRCRENLVDTVILKSFEKKQGGLR